MVETHLKNNYIDWIPVKAEEKLLVVSDRLENLEGMWDYIVVGDAFARVPAMFEGENPYQQFFDVLKKHLNPEGHILLAVDNRYGLQYFAGCKERLTGKYFEGLEGYGHSEGVRTFSKKTVMDLVKGAGFAGVKTYYPYPNYRYMTALYTDAWLPAEGSLNTNLCNFEEERLVLFDEAKVFDELIRDGKFTEFSNSYLFDLTCREQSAKEELLFLKYSVERDEKYRIRTEIVKKADGSKLVRKVPYGEAAKDHVNALPRLAQLLKEQYAPEGVQVNRCNLTEKGAEFEFLKGRTLEDLLDEYLDCNDLPGFAGELKRYREKLERLLQPEPFVPDEKFREVFGEVSFDTPQKTAQVNNIDLIFSNIILAEEQWHVIDYEWTFAFAIPMKFIVYRALALYCGRKRKHQIGLSEVCRMASITEGEAQVFTEMEHRLQKFLLGGTKTMAALQQAYAGKVMDVKELLYRAHLPEMKIYYDVGQGFSEENSEIIEAEEDFYGRRRLTLTLPANVTALRIDPCEQACMVNVHRIAGECAGAYEPVISHNGKAYKQSILYTTTDPQMIIAGIVPGTGQLHVDFTVEYLKEENVYQWMELLTKAEKCDRMEASKLFKWMKKIKNLVKKG